MSKKNKKQKRKEESGRLGAIRRRIEGHQNKIGAKAQDERLARQIAGNLYSALNDNGDSATVDAGTKDCSEPSMYDETHYLWVFEPADLDDMSVEQVFEVWKHREQLCGSKEVAAEALAIIEVADEVVESYQGWQGYINRVEISALEVPFLSDDSEESYVNGIEKNALNIAHVLELSDDDVKLSWENRPDSFASIEAACQALALLRKKAGLVNSSAWQALIEHDEIEKLKDYLPYEGASLSFIKSETDKKLIDSITFDEKKRRTSVTVVREGQQDFRKRVLKNYYGSCCISGSRITDVLEAAHISPYTGQNSNRLDNGLCLRVDIHRLFDNFLISINPEKQRVETSSKIKNDPEYGQLEGKQIIRGKVLASDYFLSQHYRTFCKREI
ncbi:MAG: HNH endonuclease [Vreelandella alkaliphila]|uniref:HNH endonuclease n=1 Tax=Halomonadaceae TaxID=28256 RepID=UPI001868959E|nr:MULTISPECIES: HNH endonuclease signature motif containing protein [unclassified Halomonas]